MAQTRTVQVSTKLTEEEVQQVQEIQKRGQMAFQEAGQIGMAEISIKERKAGLEAFIKQTREIETQMAGMLQEKYGEGQVNLETGEFISQSIEEIDEPKKVKKAKEEVPEIS